MHGLTIPTALSGAEQRVFDLPGVRSPRSTASLSRRLQSERRTRARLAVTDAAIIAVLTTTVTLGTLLPTSVFELRAPELAVVAPLLLGLVWSIMLAAFRSRESAILGSGPVEYRRVVHATVLTFGLLAVPCLITDWPSMRVQLLIALPAGLIALLLGRWQWRRWLLSRWRAGELAPRTILAGDRDEIAHVLERLDSLDSSPYRIVGAAIAGEVGAPLRFRGEAVPVLSSQESLAATAERLGADTVILASGTDADDPTRLSRQLEGTCAELLLFSRLTEVAGPRISFRPIDGLPLLRVRIPTFDGGTHVLKRVTDIAVAGAALVAVAIAAVPIALAIKLDSPGPVLFRQRRVGRDGRTFDMLKFRTMRVDAEQQLAALLAQNDGSGPLFKMRDDPRVTRVGRFLRKHSLDELPQFWNALKGDMSVVGPRPPLPHEATTYDGVVARRLYLKPGITGLWQISGRSDLTWEQSVQLDLRYVENWSVMEDLMIIFRTARVVLRPSGAY
ncbi:sugar transferase [Agrococcus sp. 1P02AA]|uniref:sugar transferase n=1 Tax=Agrococcus sp. 1P02AA TaxID=3132259 RepID=UPI0039A49AE4